MDARLHLPLPREGTVIYLGKCNPVRDVLTVHMGVSCQQTHGHCGCPAKLFRLQMPMLLAAELLVRGERPSFRALDQHRDIHIEHRPNLLEVGSPGSTVIITYELGVSAPHTDKPGEGTLHIGLIGKKNDILLAFLSGIYINSKCISLDVLEYGRRVQSLSIDIKIVASDGNLFSLCVAGINAIIARLSLKCYFTPRVFAYAGYEDRVVSDPDASELEICEWTGYAVMKSAREVLLTNVEGRPYCTNAVPIVIDKAFDDARRLASDRTA